jgi:hypothetical protein
MGKPKLGIPGTNPAPPCWVEGDMGYVAIFVLGGFFGLLLAAFLVIVNSEEDGSTYIICPAQCGLRSQESHAGVEESRLPTAGLTGARWMEIIGQEEAMELPQVMKEKIEKELPERTPQLT